MASRRVWMLLAVAVAAPGDADEQVPIRELLRTRIEARDGGSSRVGAEPLHATETASRFYQARGFEPAWWRDGRLVDGVSGLLEALQGAESHGLNPDDYHADVIATWFERDPAGAEPLGSRGVVDRELLLTDAFLVYGTHLLSGRLDSRSIDPEWIATPRATDLLPLLREVVDGMDPVEALEGLAPVAPGYRRLMGALTDLRRIDAVGGWPRIVQGATLREGDDGERIAVLRRRLEISGDLDPVPDIDAASFDALLAAAVRRFQVRHGLDPDGVVGRKTLEELDVDAGKRAEQVRVNLERWRWLPEELGRRHVRVNIAAFSLSAMEDGVDVLPMRAVVGRTYRRTPVFSGMMTYLVLNPSWHVPKRLAVEDKLPEIVGDPGYLAAQRITVLSGWGADALVVDPSAVDWSSLGPGNFPFRLRQEPGPLNALGRVKFMFPNEFNVYLHDTPARDLFGRTRRDFSSGCVRVEQPVELALWLLAPDPSWSRERIGAALATGREQTVLLPEPVPVHVEYWTAWVDPNGTPEFRRDLYGRDARVAAALAVAPPHE